jgi:hypothetical protein
LHSINLSDFREELEEEYERVLNSNLTFNSHTGRVRSLQERKDSIDLGKRAEILFKQIRKNQPLVRITQSLVQEKPELKRLGKFWIYHDLFSLESGKIFEIKCWDQKFCHTQSKGYTSFKESVGKWNFSDWLVVFAYSGDDIWLSFMEKL